MKHKITLEVEIETDDLSILYNLAGTLATIVAGELYEDVWEDSKAKLTNVTVGPVFGTTFNPNPIHPHYPASARDVQINHLPPTYGGPSSELDL